MTGPREPGRSGMTRPAEHYVHGVDAPVVIVPGRVAAWLVDRFRLNEVRTQIRGWDGQVDSVLVGIAVAAAGWRVAVTGNEHPTRPEVVAGSGEWVTAATAAGLLGITDRAVRTAADRGRLPATKVDGRWRISRENVEHFRAAREESR